MRCKWWSRSSYGSWHRTAICWGSSEWKVKPKLATMSENGFPLPHWAGTKHNDKTLKDEIGHFRFSSNPLLMSLTERMSVPHSAKIFSGHWARLRGRERMQWHARVGENTAESGDITQDTETWHRDMRTFTKHKDSVNNNLGSDKKLERVELLH